MLLLSVRLALSKSRRGGESMYRNIDVKYGIVRKWLKLYPSSSGGRSHHGIGLYFCLKSGTGKSRRLNCVNCENQHLTVMANFGQSDYIHPAFVN